MRDFRSSFFSVSVWLSELWVVELPPFPVINVVDEAFFVEVGAMVVVVVGNIFWVGEVEGDGDGDRELARVVLVDLIVLFEGWGMLLDYLEAKIN